MKYLLLFFLLVITIEGCSQSLSRNAFDKKIFSTLNERYSVTKLPNGFYKCAYSTYKKNKKGDFFSSKNLAVQCLPKYFAEIRFSDNGKKMWKIAEPYFKKSCKKNINMYKNEMDVNGYCNCLAGLYEERIKNYDKYHIELNDLINPEFLKSKIYTRMAIHCVKQNKF